MYAALIAGKKQSDEWIVDSGSTSHLTNNIDALIDKRSCERSDITVANNEKLKIECAGQVTMSVCSGEHECEAKLTDVKYVPNLCANLVSVRQMTKMGNRIVFEGDTCEIFNANRELMATASVVNGLYRLNCKVKLNQREETQWSRVLISTFGIVEWAIFATTI